MVDPPSQGRCVKCGYDLRGITSDVCPECGAPTHFLCVKVADPLQYHRARAALAHEGLLMRSIDPGGTLGTLNTVYGLAIDGLLWVDPNQLDRVEECLDRAGVVSQIHARPIVDRSEPNCPKCNCLLDANGPEVCPACGADFHWVDIASEPIDPTGQACRYCGYELTGNVSGDCPECGGSVAASVLPNVGAYEISEFEIHRSKSAWTSTLIIFCIAGLMVCFMVLLVANPTSAIIAFLIFAGAASYTLLIRYYLVHRRRPRQ